MSIPEITDKIKSLVGNLEKSDFMLFGIIILVAITSFSIGRLSNTQTRGEPVIISNAIPFPTATNLADPSVAGVSTSQGSFVASVNGTKYYPVDCSGADRISEQNKIYFNSALEASTAGYELSVLCE